MNETEWDLRFKALGDISDLLKVAAPQYRSPKEYFQKLIVEEENKAIAEKRLRLLEDLKADSEEEKINLQMERIRRERDKNLKNSDWTQLADAPLDSQEKKEYRKYREFLRELPELVKDSKVESHCKTFIEWKSWVKNIRHTPGYEKYVL